MAPPLLQHQISSRINGKTDFENVHMAVKLCDPRMLEKFKCSFGNHLMRKPIQTCRGELACEDCYAQAKRDDGKCPIDFEPIESKEMRDRAKEKDISNLECFCTYNSYGCSWVGSVGKLEAHLEQCPYKPINCKLCGEEINPLGLNEHLKICSKFLANGGCPYQECSFKSKSVEKLRHHLKDDVILHAFLHSSVIHDLQEKVERQSVMLETLMKEHEAAAQKKSDVETLKEQVSFLMKTLQETEAKNNALSNKLEEKINEFESNGKRDEVNTEVFPSGDFSLGQLTTEISMINKTVSELDLRQQLYENTSYDGKLVWKIDNIKARYEQALDGKITALHSAPTYTCRNKYKFCARLYLNGDGVGRGECVSLFFVLMRSEYDDLLQWPFRNQVTFRLINQIDRTKSVKETFSPDKHSQSFSKPVKEMNIASGCPRFIGKKKFFKEGFVENNCIYIEVEVGQSSGSPEWERKH